MPDVTSAATVPPKDRLVENLAIAGLGAAFIWFIFRTESQREQKQGESTYMPLVKQAAANANLPAAILGGTVFKESNWSNAPNSCARAKGWPCILGGCNEKEITVGLAQMRPSVARENGYSGPDEGLCDPATNLMVAARIMKKYFTRYNGDAAKAYSAYNAGGGATDRAIAKAAASGGDWIDYIPATTRNSYVPKALAAAEEYRGSGVAGVMGVAVPKVSLFRFARQAA